MKLCAIKDVNSEDWYKPAYVTRRRWQPDIKRAKFYKNIGHAKTALRGIKEREAATRKPEIVEVGDITITLNCEEV